MQAKQILFSRNWTIYTNNHWSKIIHSLRRAGIAGYGAWLPGMKIVTLTRPAECAIGTAVRRHQVSQWHPRIQWYLGRWDIGVKLRTRSPEHRSLLESEMPTWGIVCSGDHNTRHSETTPGTLEHFAQEMFPKALLKFVAFTVSVDLIRTIYLHKGLLFTFLIWKVTKFLTQVTFFTLGRQTILTDKNTILYLT